MGGKASTGYEWREWRRMQAVELTTRGWPPQAIATALGVTAAAVSKEAGPAPLSPDVRRAAFERVRARLVGKQDGSPSQAGVGATQIDRRTDCLLLLLHMAGKIWGITRVVKLLFLMGKEGGCDRSVPDFYAHVAYDFGPFDDAVYEDLDALKRLQFVAASKPPRREPANGDVAVGLSEREVDAVYHLTPQGEKFASQLAVQAGVHDPAVVQGIESVVRHYGRMSLKDLLRYVYKTYPEYAEKSKIRDEVLGTDDE